MSWYLKVLQQYVDFKGRARRKEYWMFILINVIISIVLTLISDTLGGLYSLAVLLPSIAVLVRRLHDTDRTGWWALLLLLPLIGPVILIVFMCFDSQPGENQYGPNPKGM